MQRKLLTLFAAAVAAGPAYAHGEDVFLSIYSQLFAVIAVLVSLRFIPASKGHWFAGAVGCFGGVVFSWLATANVPYTDNRVYITILGVVAPVLLSALFVYAARRYAAKSHQA